MGKALALTSVLASPVYNSGCLPLAVVGGAAIVANSNREAAEIEAKGRRDAAVIQTQNNVGNYQLPGIIIISIADLNKNNIAEPNEPIMTLENGVYNNSIISFWALKERYSGRKFRYVLKNEIGSLYDKTIFLDERTDGKLSKVFQFDVGNFKRGMEEKGFEDGVKGVKLYQIDYFKDDERLPLDSKAFLIDYNASCPIN